MSDRVEALAKRAGVRLNFHTLRKGFGCRYAGKVPAQVLQKLMRHSSIKTTMDYYANVDDAAVRAVLGDESTLRVSSRVTQPQGSPRASGGAGAKSTEESTSDFS
jgi:integrase